MRIALLLVGSLVLASCGGKVVVDGQGDPGAGGGSTSSSSAGTGASSSTGGADCPAFPHIQGPCSIPGQVCPVPFGCCGGDAVCGPSAIWLYQSPACAEACIPCTMTFGCSGAAICVDYQTEFSESFGCQKDPCPGSSDCSCAEPVCQGAGLSCQSHAPTLLICDCPNC